MSHFPNKKTTFLTVVVLLGPFLQHIYPRAELWL